MNSDPEQVLANAVKFLIDRGDVIEAKQLATCSIHSLDTKVIYDDTPDEFGDLQVAKTLLEVMVECPPEIKLFTEGTALFSSAKLALEALFPEFDFVEIKNTLLVPQNWREAFFADIEVNEKVDTIKAEPNLMSETEINYRYHIQPTITPDPKELVGKLQKLPQYAEFFQNAQCTIYMHTIDYWDIEAGGLGIEITFFVEAKYISKLRELEDDLWEDVLQSVGDADSSRYIDIGLGIRFSTLEAHAKTAEKRPKPYPRIFISYSRDDKHKTENLAGMLKKSYEHVWHDHDLTAGEDWWEEIVRQITACDCFIMLISNEALNSEYCLREFDLAVKLKKYIIPIKVRRSVNIPDDLNKYQLIEMLGEVDAFSINDVYAAIIRKFH